METDSADIPDSLDLSSPLWVYALALWQTPGAESLCLALQKKGWSVTRLLCACWLSSLGKEFTGEPENVVQWRTQMTSVIRLLKQSLPKNHNALTNLREQLASAELEAERIELALTYQAIAAGPVPGYTIGQSIALARHNVYAAAPDKHINPEVSQLVDQLITLMLPNYPIQTDR